MTVVIQVSDVELTGIGLKYDANDNEVIDREEAVAAVSDYFRGSHNQRGDHRGNQALLHRLMQPAGAADRITGEGDRIA